MDLLGRPGAKPRGAGGAGDDETDALEEEAATLLKATKRWLEAWQELLRRVRRWAVNASVTPNAAAARAGAPEGFAPQLRALAARSAGTPIQALATVVADTLDQTEAVRSAVADEALRVFVDPMEAFIARIMMPARQESKKIKKAKAAISTSATRVRAVQERPQLDMAALHAAQRDVWEARYRYRRVARAALALLRAAVALAEPTGAAALADWALALAQRVAGLREHSAVASRAARELADAARRWSEQWLHERAERDSTNAKRDALSQQETLSRLVSELANPSLVVASAVATSVPGVDLPSLLVSVLDAFRFSLPVIAAGIAGEVSGTNKASTLFRGNSMSTKLMAAYTRQTGLPYLRATLGPHVTALILLPPHAVEVDPKVHAGAGAAELAALDAATQAMLDAVFGTVDAIPVPLRWMARTLRDAVLKRFPDAARQAVGGFLFLRFICPALLSPEHHGLADGSLKPEQRRPLTLVTKIIQNLSNEVQFGAKEAFMVPLNALLARNAAAMQAFLDAAVALPETDIARVAVMFEPLATVAQCRRTLMPQLIEMTVSNLDKVAHKMREAGQAPEVVPLADLLAQIVAFEGHVISGSGALTPPASSPRGPTPAATGASPQSSPRPATPAKPLPPSPAGAAAPKLGAGGVRMSSARGLTAAAKAADKDP